MDRVQEIPLNQSVGNNEMSNFHLEEGEGRRWAGVQKAKTPAFPGTLKRRKTEREAKNARGIAIERQNPII